MASASRRRLIVNADDFGASSGINAAVKEAHQRGILTTASLMVNGDAAAEAIAWARANPTLGVGLHLTLCCGRATLAPSRVRRLANARGEFRESPAGTGLIYFFSKAARLELAQEIRAQLDKFQETGLTMDHLNGHLHFHLHPTVLALILREARQRSIRAMRLTYDPVRLDWPLGRGRLIYRASHALIFSMLARRTAPMLRRAGIVHSQCVFGLLETERVTEDYILRLLERLPAGDSELYSHPCVEKFEQEHQALISPRVIEAIQARGIELIRYQDLWRN